MFQIKDFVSITASMLNHIRGTTTKITDLIPGSVSRTLVEAPAVEIEELYLQIFNGLREAIPVATFKSFGFEKLPAKYARGFVSVSRPAPPSVAMTVAAGTTFTSSDGRAYLSTQDVVWPTSASSVRIPVIAERPGLAYNISAGSITASTAFDSTHTISNSTINNGRDVETDTEREARFRDFIGSLSRGTIFACITAAESASVLDGEGNLQEYVTRSGFTEISGYVKIFIYSSAGYPSRELIANGQRLIDGWKDPEAGTIVPGYRSGGVNVEVASMVEKAVALTARVSLLSGYSLDEVMKQNILDAYASLLAAVPSGGILYADAIEGAILGVRGVRSVVLVSAQNVACEQGEVLVPGEIAVTAL